MAVLLLHMRRAHTLRNPCLLDHFRLLSTSNSKNNFAVSWEQFENKSNKLSVSLLSLRDKYAIDSRLSLEMITSRQAFLNETIEHQMVLSALPSWPSLLPRETSERGINILDRCFMRLHKLLVEEDEMSLELTNSRLAYLQEIINNFSSISRLPKEWNEFNNKRYKLNVRLMRLRRMEMGYSRSTTPLLSQTMNNFCALLKKINLRMRLREMMGKQENDLSGLSGLTSYLQVMKDLSAPPQLDDERRREMWNELNETWDEFNKQRKRLREMDPPGELPCGRTRRKKTYYWCMRLKKIRVMKKQEDKLSAYSRQTCPSDIFCEKMKTFHSHLRLREMLFREDELSAEFTNNRLTSLQEIINNLSEIRSSTYVPPMLDEGQGREWNELNERWIELNEGLMRLRKMEVEDSCLLAVRSVSQLVSISQSIKNLLKICGQINSGLP